MDGTYLTIGDLAEKAQISQQTLRRWDKSGKLRPAVKLKNGTRLYSPEQAKTCIESCKNKLQAKLTAMEDANEK